MKVHPFFFITVIGEGVAGLWGIQPTQAQDCAVAPISADRPGFSTPTAIVPLGDVQLEAGATASRFGDERDYSFGELLLRVPVTERAELRVGLPSYRVSRADKRRVSGADDLFVETKILLSSDKHAAYALLLNSLLPTGSREASEHRFQPGAALAADFTLSQAVGLTLNLGYAHASDGGERYDQVFGVSSINLMLTPDIGSFAEVYAFNPADGPVQKYVDGGFTYLLNARTQLDVSGGVGLDNASGGPDYFYGFGISRLF
jgi:hypothetical protein